MTLDQKIRQHLGIASDGAVTLTPTKSALLAVLGLHPPRPIDGHKPRRAAVLPQLRRDA